MKIVDSQQSDIYVPEHQNQSYDMDDMGPDISEK